MDFFVSIGWWMIVILCAISSSISNFSYINSRHKLLRLIGNIGLIAFPIFLGGVFIFYGSLASLALVFLVLFLSILKHNLLWKYVDRHISGKLRPYLEQLITGNSVLMKSV